MMTNKIRTRTMRNQPLQVYWLDAVRCWGDRLIEFIHGMFDSRPPRKICPPADRCFCAWMIKCYCHWTFLTGSYSSNSRIPTIAENSKFWGERRLFQHEHQICEYYEWMNESDRIRLFSLLKTVSDAINRSITISCCCCCCWTNNTAQVSIFY